jgi:hypothetical protein
LRFSRSIDTDDFQGDCDGSINFDTFSDYRAKPKVKLNIPKTTEKNYPLLRTLNDAIVITLDEMRQEMDLIKENEIDGGDSAKNDENHKHGSNPSKASTAAVAFSSLLAAIFCFLMSSL